VKIPKSSIIGFAVMALSSCSASSFQQSGNNGTLSLQRISILKSADIRGPLQGFGLNAQGQGAIMWGQQSNGTVTSMGRLLKTFLPDKPFMSNLVGPKTGFFNYQLIPNSYGYLIGNIRSFSVFPTINDLNGQLNVIPLSESNSMSVLQKLGDYQLLNMAFDEKGKGSLLLCKEYLDTGDGLPTPSAYIMEFTQSDGLITGSPRLIKELPGLREDVFIGGSLDLKGNGLLFWMRDGKVYSQKFMDFKPLGEELPLGFVPLMEKENFFIQVSEGNGFIAWRIEAGLQVFRVNDYVVDSNGKSELNFPVNVGYLDAQLNHLMVRSWDVKISPQGQGLAAWVSPDHEQAYYQQIKDFKFVGSPQSVTQNTDGMQFGMLRVSVNDEGPMVISGLDMKCTYRTAGGQCLADSGRQKEIWMSKSMK
jgi:hypothetical protein